MRFVWFDAGRILAVTSARDDEKLGSWLVARGLLRPQVLGDLLASKPTAERLGSVLVRRGVLPTSRLRAELEELSLALLGRVAFAGGELVGEGGVSLPLDARMVEASPRGLLVAAARRAEDLGVLEPLLGAGKAWTTVAPGTAPGDGEGLSDLERYLFSLLRRPRTLDELRRVALYDYADLLRGLAVLAVADLIVTCKVSKVLPAAVPLAERYREQDEPLAGPAVAAPGRALTLAPVAAPSGGSRLQAVLATLDQNEQADVPPQGSAGQAASGANCRRAEALLATATRMLAAGEDRRAVRRVLLHALEVAPGASVMLKLAEVELAEVHLAALGLERLKQVVALAPRCTKAWLALAGHWGSRGHPEKQRACAEKVLAYEPANAEARRLAGRGPAS